MFNPTDFDKVCVQAIHIELGGRSFNFSHNASKHLEIKDSKDNKRKRSSKGKKATTTQNGCERPTCTHC